MQTKEDFENYVSRHKNFKQIDLMFDIETLQYNELEGRKKPSLFKNVTYSVAVSWYDEEKGEEVQRHVFKSFKYFFESFFDGCKRFKNSQPTCKAKINLIAHNSNKYDNHYLLKDICYFYPEVVRKNIFLQNAINNDMTVKIRELKNKSQKQALILEKRVKSSNNLELDFFLKGIHFFTTDNWVKTNLSIATIGKKLLKNGLIKESELKTSFDYTKYNLDEDMEDTQAYAYAEKVFDTLNKEQMTYIENDVIILAKCVKYYSIIFPNFDYTKMTFTSNILEFYNDNEITQFQLLNEIGKARTKTKINYTDYRFAGSNFYDFLKAFYRGGLNFYNHKYVSKIVKNAFSIDINSSYPFVMYAFKIPTFLKKYAEYEREKIVTIEKDDSFYLYRMTKEAFNTEILLEIGSKVIRSMLVKYYTVAINNYVNINTNTIKMINNVCHVNINQIHVLAWIEYECVDFGSKEKIFDNYKIKTQGKLKNKIKMESPMVYKILDELNTDIFTIEEVANSKVLLNGLYGIPALRAYFNLFRLLPDDTLENIPNGYKNTERNIVFSIFVTSMAIYNLLSPLAYLTQEEIDEYFIYCDTDSLYLKIEAYNKIPSEIFDPISLGKWDIEHAEIEKMYVLNHKKYCMFTDDKIIVKCGGIDLNSFDTNMTFEHFIATQFHHGCEIKNTKSIYNQQGTISIYESTTKIEEGKAYPTAFSKSLDRMKEKMLERIADEIQNGLADILYIESELGTFSQADIKPRTHTIEQKENLWHLKAVNAKIKNLLYY